MPWKIGMATITLFALWSKLSRGLEIIGFPISGPCYELEWPSYICVPIYGWWCRPWKWVGSEMRCCEKSAWPHSHDHLTHLTFFNLRTPVHFCLLKVSSNLRTAVGKMIRGPPGQIDTVYFQVSHWIWPPGQEGKLGPTCSSPPPLSFSPDVKSKQCCDKAH